MTSQGYYGISEHAGRETETPHGFPTRVAAAIVILVALTFVDATPQLAFDPVSTRPHREQYVPSACGAEAVARAQRELDPDRPRPPSPTALS